MTRRNNLADKPVLGSSVTKAMDCVAQREMDFIAKHFANYLTPLIANEDASRNASFNIRHQVYCEELQFEEQTPEKLESDEFDQYSVHCLIKHIPSSRYS